MRKSPTHLSSPHHVPRQGLAQVCESFSKPVALQIRHSQTPVARTLDADLSTDHWPSTFPEQSGEGSLKRQLMCLRQWKYNQSVKDQGEDVRGAPPWLLRTTSLKVRFPPEHSPYLVLLTNFAPVGGRARTTTQGCGRVRHSCGRTLEGYHYLSKHRAANLHFCQS